MLHLLTEGKFSLSRRIPENGIPKETRDYEKVDSGNTKYDYLSRIPDEQQSERVFRWSPRRSEKRDYAPMAGSIPSSVTNSQYPCPGYIICESLCDPVPPLMIDVLYFCSAALKESMNVQIS